MNENGPPRVAQGGRKKTAEVLMEIILAQALEERLRPLARRQHVRRERGQRTKHKIPVYLPERVLEALRPNVSASIDQIMATLPRQYWATGRVDWSRHADVFGRPRKTTLSLSRRYRPGDVSRAVAGYLKALMESYNLQLKSTKKEVHYGAASN